MNEKDMKKANKLLNMVTDTKIKLVERFIEDLTALKNAGIEQCKGSGVVLVNEKDWENLMNTYIKDYENMKKIFVEEYK